MQVSKYLPPATFTLHFHHGRGWKWYPSDVPESMWRNGTRHSLRLSYPSAASNNPDSVSRTVHTHDKSEGSHEVGRKSEQCCISVRPSN